MAAEPGTPAPDRAFAPRRERVQKLLAAAGLGSRRACEALIAAGRVTVNGRTVALGDRADPRDVVAVDGERVHVDPDRVYVALNKPRGVVTTAFDPAGRPTVMDLVNLPQRLFPVGRLDQDTEGLLLLTNDGALAHRLMHPSFGLARVYVALVAGPVRNQTLRALRAGVELDDGAARPAAVRLLSEERGQALLEVTLTEGRKREVRRLLAAVGLDVRRLARVQYGAVELGDLRQGKWRFLTPHEVGQLEEAVNRLDVVSPQRQDAKSTSRPTRQRT